MISLQVNDGVTEAAIPFTPYLKDNETRYSVPEKGRRSTRIPDLYWPKEIVTNNLDEDETEKKRFGKSFAPWFRNTWVSLFQRYCLKKQEKSKIFFRKLFLPYL